MPDEPFDFWTHYFSDGNPVREYDERNGIRVSIDMNGTKRFCISVEALNAETESRMPLAYRERWFNDFIVAAYKDQQTAGKALKTAQRYVERFDENADGIGLYIVSATKGSGKTHLASILGNELDNRGKNVCFRTAPAMLDELKSTFDNKERSTLELERNFTRAEVLVIDDLGTQKTSEWVNEFFFKLIDGRMLAKKPTVITSNVMPDKLNLDGRIRDRIQSGSIIVRLPEENVRVELGNRRAEDFKRMLLE